MATLKDTLVLGKLTVVDKIVKSGATSEAVLMGDGSLGLIGTRSDATYNTPDTRDDRNYLVQRNNAGSLVVCVPWEAGSSSSGGLNSFTINTTSPIEGGKTITSSVTSLTLTHSTVNTSDFGVTDNNKVITKISVNKYGHVTSVTSADFNPSGYISGTIVSNNASNPATNAVTPLGWADSDKTTNRFPTINLLAYWNGAYSGTSSNLTYCKDGTIASQTWVENKGYTTGSSLTANNIIIGNGGSTIKSSGCTISTIIYDQDGDADQGDQGIPNVHAVASYVLGKGYTTNTGNVTTSDTLDSGYFVLGNGSTDVKSCQFKPTGFSTAWAATNDYNLPSMRAISNYVSNLGYTSNTGTITEVIAGNGLTGGGSSGSVTINAKSGTGISITADAIALASISGMSSASYGPSNNQSLNHSGTFKVPYITTDKYGRITAIKESTMTLPSGSSGGTSSTDDAIYEFDEDYGELNINSIDFVGSGVNAGDYNSSYDASTGALVIPNFTVNEGGRLTAASTSTYTVKGGGGSVSGESSFDILYAGYKTQGGYFLAADSGGVYMGSPGTTIPTNSNTSLHVDDSRATFNNEANFNGDAYFYGEINIADPDSFYLKDSAGTWRTFSNYIKNVVFCLAEGTLITMADGSKKKIEDVREGEELLSYDLTTKTLTTAICLMNRDAQKQQRSYHYVFDNGTRLILDWTHDMYNASKDIWCDSAKELYINDELLTQDGNRTKFLGTIDWVNHKTGKAIQYYHIVTSNCCYFANELLMASNPLAIVPWADLYINAPEHIRETIYTYKDENSVYSDLVENDDYVMEHLKYMGKIKEKEGKLSALREELANTDYVALKQYEGHKPKTETMEARKWWREVYNVVEEELRELKEKDEALKLKYSSLGEDVKMAPLDLRRKFFYEAHQKGNGLLEEFKNFYKEKRK